MSSTLIAPAAVPLRRDAPTIGLISLAHGVSHFCQLIVPPLFPWLGSAFGLSNTQLGALLSVFFVVSCVGQALAGFVVDRYGASRVLFGGLTCLAVAAVGLAVSPSYAMLLVFMALAGVGNCVFHPVDYSILNARVSTPRLGQAYAAHGISGNLGWAAAPLFVVGIAHATGSWRAALVGVALLVTAVIALLAATRSSWSAQAAVASPHGKADATGQGGSLAFLRLAAVWSCFVFFLMFALSLGGVQSFAPAAAGKLHDVPAAQVAVCLSVYMVASAGGMLLGGQLVRDPGRSTRMVSLGVGMAAVVALLMALGDWPAAIVPVLFGAMGLGMGISAPSRDLLVRQATPPGATGRVYGVVYSGLDVGMALSPLIFGALMDAGHYRAVWIAIAAVLVLMIANAFNVRGRRRPVLATAR